MSGHSKWNNIKRKKEKTDGARAKVFTKIGREIAVAVKEGGGNPASNSKLAALIAKAKAMPGQLTYASSGNGNSPHLAMASFALRTQLQLVHVPYRGVAPAITDLMAGRVDLMFADLPALIGPARDKAVVALALGSAEQSPALPGVPTLEQAGVHGVDVENWYGIVAPAGTPQDRILRLHQAISAALAQPEARQRLADLGVRIIGSGPSQFASHLQRETAKWADLIREANITLE